MSCKLMVKTLRHPFSFQYYDWEENACRLLDLSEDENSFRHIESDISIPGDIDIESAIGSKEFHDFEPAKLEQVGNLKDDSTLTIILGSSVTIRVQPRQAGWHLLSVR